MREYRPAAAPDPRLHGAASVAQLREPGFGFGRAMLGLEAALVDALALQAVPLTEELVTVHGELQGTPVELTARAYRGRWVRHARVVTISGRPRAGSDPGLGAIDVASVLVIPAPTLAAPCFAADLLAVSDRGLTMADLVPVVPTSVAVQQATRAALRARLPAAGFATETRWGAVPADCQSERAFQAWVTPAQGTSALRTVRAYADAFTAVLPCAPAWDARAAQSAVLEQLRAHAPTANLLAFMFGRSFAATLMARVMYPLQLP